VTALRHIAIAGAGIGGLTAALALARVGHRVTVFEQSARLEEAGAGLQLSPNATRILLDLGLGDALRPVVVAPEALEVRAASGRRIVRMPLGRAAEMRYGAPYWMLHRADLQAGLIAAAEVQRDISIQLDSTVEDFAPHPHGLSLRVRRGSQIVSEHAAALIGADGLWSTTRTRIDAQTQPQFRRRAAWRSLLRAAKAPDALREPVVQLWLGHDAHLVHYPVCGGDAINIVAIAADAHEQAGWSGAASAQDLISRFPERNWAAPARTLLHIPQTWARWRLYDMPPLRKWGEGPVTLVGDAAHPMLPFLAQGAAMAIEDAAVLAHCVAELPDDAPAAFRAYEAMRRARVAEVQAAARRNGQIYHLGGAAALVRDVGMRVVGGDRLLRRYDWIYRWCAPGRAR
jgi:salicylate hydroxylase